MIIRSLRIKLILVIGEISMFNGSQNGLGTANVRNFLNEIGTAQNVFECYGGINSNIHIEPDFDLKYKYDKVLYIEKTGFDAIFKRRKDWGKI